MLLTVLPMLVIWNSSATSSLPQIQEQFSKLSVDIDRQLQHYRAKNSFLRRQVTDRILNALGNLTVEVRDITGHYWIQIEAHQLATPECLELIRPHFYHYAAYAQQDVQAMAQDLARYMAEDAANRFFPVVSEAQRGSSRAIHRPLQTLSENFGGNLSDTVFELHNELEYFQEWWKEIQGRLRQEIDGGGELECRADDALATWYEFIVKWHHFFLGMQLERVDYECDTEHAGLIKP